jgi:putative membrane protein
MNVAVIGFIVGGALLAAAPPTPSSLDDSKILEVVEVANTGPIEQAELAVSRTQTPTVKSFARAMIEDQTDAREEGRAVAKRIGVSPAPSPMSNELKAANNQIIMQLRPLQKSQFDRAYVDSQITMHKRVLGLIDDQLLPGAQAEEVKALLSGMRGSLDEHLEKAEKILEKLP